MDIATRKVLEAVAEELTDILQEGAGNTTLEQRLADTLVLVEQAMEIEPDSNPGYSVEEPGID